MIAVRFRVEVCRTVQHSPYVLLMCFIHKAASLMRAQSHPWIPALHGNPGMPSPSSGRWRDAIICWMGCVSHMIVEPGVSNARSRQLGRTNIETQMVHVLSSCIQNNRPCGDKLRNNDWWYFVLIYTLYGHFIHHFLFIFLLIHVKLNALPEKKKGEIHSEM